MNGQYPGDGSGEYMTAWYDFMAGNRYWDLEPYFGLDGGRALALEGVEYIIYVEKPGPVEVDAGASRVTMSRGSIRRTGSGLNRRIIGGSGSRVSLRTGRMTGCCIFPAKARRQGC